MAEKGKQLKEGDKFICSKDCGLVIKVEKACECVDCFEFICCGEEMKSV